MRTLCCYPGTPQNPALLFFAVFSVPTSTWGFWRCPFSVRQNTDICRFLSDRSVAFIFASAELPVCILWSSLSAFPVLPVCWLNRPRPPLLNFSHFSLEASKYILLAQSRLKISFSECTGFFVCLLFCFAAFFTLRNSCKALLCYGSDPSISYTDSGIFLPVLLLLKYHLGLQPHSHCAVFLNFFASLSCAFPDLMTVLGQTGSMKIVATSNGNSAPGMPEDILKWQCVCEMVMNWF